MLPSAAGACFARKAVVRDARQPPGRVPAQSRKQDAAGPTGAVLLLCSASGYVEWGNRWATFPPLSAKSARSALAIIARYANGLARPRVPR